MTLLHEILGRIEERLVATGLSASAASDRAGLSRDAIRNIKRTAETTPDAGVSTKTLIALAAVLGTTAAYLLDGTDGEATGLREHKDRLVPVIKAGKVAAGVFREVDDLDQREATKILEPVDDRFPHARRMMFDVEGNSMNALKPRPIFDGDLAVCVSFEDVASEVRVRDGLIVVVERTRDGGHTREWSLKQVELYEDRIEFHPRSTDPRFKPIIVRRDAGADEGVQVEIIGLLRAVRTEFPI